MTWNPNKSLEIIDISDSDSESRGPQIPLHSQTSPANSEVGQIQESFSPCESSDVLVIDSTDSEDLDDLETKFKRVYFEERASTVASYPKTSDPTHTRPAPRIELREQQNDILVLSSSEEGTEDTQPTMRYHAPNSNNSTNHKTSNPAVRPRKKKSGIIGEIPIVSKAQEKEKLKDQAKLQREINKLVTDKKSTLKDFTVELSRTFEGNPFVDCLESKLAAHGCRIFFFEPTPQSEFLIRFRRQHIARYDNNLKEWVPVTPYTALEDLYVLFLSADTLATSIFEETLTKTLSTFRDTYGLTTRSQIFIIVDGLNSYYKRKSGPKNKRRQVESALTSLQALERCFIVQVEGAEDAAQWLFNITGDLGIKPHKRIRDSFLPFCTDTQIKCGSSKTDTYMKMLQQIRNITESAAEGIIKEAPTLRELFEGYAREPDTHRRLDRLKDVTVSRRKDGAAKSRILNQALSTKMHDVIWGEDPLTLI